MLEEYGPEIICIRIHNMLADANWPLAGKILYLQIAKGEGRGKSR